MNPIIEINEPIDVIASFSITKHKDKLIPLQIHWAGRDIDITAIGLHHPTREGNHLYHIFEVTDGANDYCLQLDTVTLTWTLLSMIDGSNL